MQFTRGQRLFWVSCSTNWLISRPHPNFAKTWVCIWIASSLVLALKPGLGILQPAEGKVSKTSWPCVSLATSVYITNIHMFMYVQSQGPQTTHAGFICSRTNQSCVCMCVCVYVCAFMRVWIWNCSSHFPQAFELWIIVLVSWTIMKSG